MKGIAVRIEDNQGWEVVSGNSIYALAAGDYAVTRMFFTEQRQELYDIEFYLNPLGHAKPHKVIMETGDTWTFEEGRPVKVDYN